MSVKLRAPKYSLNFSFVGLLLQVILSGTSWFWCFGHWCNKNKNVYTIRPNAAKFLSISCYLYVPMSVVSCLIVA